MPPKRGVAMRKKYFRWTQKATKRLLKMWLENLSDFRGYRKNISIIKEMANNMKEFEISTVEIKAKMDNMKRKYRTESLRIISSRIKKSKWLYFPKMQHIMENSDDDIFESDSDSSKEFEFPFTDIKRNGIERYKRNHGQAEDCDESDEEIRPTQLYLGGSNFKEANNRKQTSVRLKKSGADNGDFRLNHNSFRNEMNMALSSDFDIEKSSDSFDDEGVTSFFTPSTKRNYKYKQEVNYSKENSFVEEKSTDERSSGNESDSSDDLIFSKWNIKHYELDQAEAVEEKTLAVQRKTLKAMQAMAEDLSSFHENFLKAIKPTFQKHA
ncbi:uncharacterized protein LOC108100375 [Drosophila ficusphila]|uniref:uncharacterized protein LOC108100375 n=1 Tax=Drosophila ficusphila TaxID=30025 RepID=UPI0007E7D810|nr:uncharacterized protein LOC108100375 [Drosophila ficusphila]